MLTKDEKRVAKKLGVFEERKILQASKRQVRQVNLPSVNNKVLPPEEQLKALDRSIKKVEGRLRKLLKKNPGVSGLVVKTNLDQVKSGNVKDAHDWKQLIDKTFPAARTPEDEIQIMKLQSILNQKYFDRRNLFERIRNPHFNRQSPSRSK